MPAAVAYSELAHHWTPVATQIFGRFTKSRGLVAPAQQREALHGSSPGRPMPLASECDAPRQVRRMTLQHLECGRVPDVCEHVDLDGDFIRTEARAGDRAMPFGPDYMGGLRPRDVCECVRKSRRRCLLEHAPDRLRLLNTRQFTSAQEITL